MSTELKPTVEWLQDRIKVEQREVENLKKENRELEARLIESELNNDIIANKMNNLIEDMQKILDLYKKGGTL